jgi:hypothetical protein
MVIFTAKPNDSKHWLSAFLEIDGDTETTLHWHHKHTRTQARSNAETSVEEHARINLVFFLKGIEKKTLFFLGCTPFGL